MYLFSNSAYIHRQISSRVPNSDHQYVLPLQVLSTAVVPAVEVPAFKILNAWKSRESNKPLKVKTRLLYWHLQIKRKALEIKVFTLPASFI